MFFLTMLLGIGITLLVDFPIAAVIGLVYKLVILAIFPTLPILTFWQMYGIVVVLSLIGSFFKGGGSSNDK